MRAIGLIRFGGPEVLQMMDMPSLEPVDTEVRIQVEAFTVNPADIQFRLGLNRHYMRRAEPPWVPGVEVAGVVDAVGPSAKFEVGDRVAAVVGPFTTGHGGYAEHVLAPSDSVFATPSRLDAAHAATLPTNGLTAMLALEALNLKPGQSVGLTGSAGSVGGYVIQIARNREAADNRRRC